MDKLKEYFDDNDIFVKDNRYMSFEDKNGTKYIISYNYYYKDYSLKKDNKYILQRVELDCIINYIEKLDIQTRGEWLEERVDSCVFCDPYEYY